MEVLVQIDAGDLIHYIDDGMRVTIGQGTVIFVAIPAAMFRAPHTAVAFEFINTNGFREFGWPAKVDGLKDRLDGALGDMVSPCNLGEGERLYQVQEDGVIESLRHTQGRMDPVGSLIERCEWHNKNTHFYRRKYPTLLCLKAFYRYTESVIKILRLRRDNDYAGGRYENNDSNVIQERV